MAKKVEMKTKETRASVPAFLDSIEDAAKRADVKKLLAIFKKVTGKPAKMWGPSIVGFGSYTYTRANGDTAEFMATGFSPRASALTLYIMPGYEDYGALLAKLGSYKLGKSCLYIKKLDDIDTKVLETLIKQGLTDLKKLHKVG